MKNVLLFLLGITAILLSCNYREQQDKSNTPVGTNHAAADLGQESVEDDISKKDIVKIAVSSKDHTTLVAALKQAEYVNDLANVGPFTVFAPTNAAFDKLPPGTVDGLMKPDKRNALKEILEYHVAVGVYKEDLLQDGQSIGTANGASITINKTDGKLRVNGTANVIASIWASNGLIYVVDEVLLPPSK